MSTVEKHSSSLPATRAVFIIWTAVWGGNPASSSSSSISTTMALSWKACSPEPMPSERTTPSFPPGSWVMAKVSPEIF